MNNKDKLKLFWKITNHINKKCCKNKLVINNIKLFKNEMIKGELTTGYYNGSKKEIGISSKNPLLNQIRTLHHELAHASQHQIEKLSPKKRSIHKTGCFKKYIKFLEETDKILKIGSI